jgi:hypothetical protein
MIGRSCLATFFVLCTLAGTPAAAQGDAPASDRLGVELAGIRRALDRLVELQQVAERYRDAELLMKRIELCERRLEPLERQVHDARAEVKENETRLERLARTREQNERKLEQEVREGTDAPDSETRRVLDEIDRMEQRTAEQQEDAQARLEQLELELSARRAAIDVLDDRLLDMLEALER